jgi:carbonic anhydrase
MNCFSGQRARLKHFSILSFLPNKEHYITYDGSFTQPGCYETVTWMILNRPIGVTHEQVSYDLLNMMYHLDNFIDL